MLVAWSIALALAVASAKRTARSTAYAGYCNSETKGFVTKLELRLPEVEVPRLLDEFYFHIPDKCRELDKELVGSAIDVCDEDVAPTMVMAESGVGYACLRRHGVRFGTAHVYIHQYCL